MNAKVSTSPGLLVRRLAVLLNSFAFRYASEIQLHQGIASVLDAEGIAYAREVVLDANSRLDFLVEDAVAIEVKVGGSLSLALGQVNRYCAHGRVGGVLLAATQGWARHPLPRASGAFHGKPVELAWLRRKAL